MHEGRTAHLSRTVACSDGQLSELGARLSRGTHAGQVGRHEGLRGGDECISQTVWRPRGSLSISVEPPGCVERPCVEIPV